MKEVFANDPPPFRFAFTEQLQLRILDGSDERRVICFLF